MKERMKNLIIEQLGTIDGDLFIDLMEEEKLGNFLSYTELDGFSLPASIPDSACLAKKLCKISKQAAHSP